MINISVKVEGGVVPPAGNGFPVYAYHSADCMLSGSNDGMFLTRVYSGLVFDPAAMTDKTLILKSAPDAFVFTHKLETDGSLYLIVLGSASQGTHLANAWIVSMSAPPIRFATRNADGTRMMRGNPVQIKTNEGEQK